MFEPIPIAQKLGCDKHAIDSCILVKSSVEKVNSVFSQYFELEVHPNCKIEQYVDFERASWKEVERQRQVLQSKPKKSFPPIPWAVPVWKYLNHQWTILSFWHREENESVACVLAQLLNADVITFFESDNAVFREFKVFRQDRFVEHYLFGSECGYLLADYWEINVEFELCTNWLYEHHFKSSIRSVSESDVILTLSANKEEKGHRGFLDACLKYYQAYIPLYEETPYEHRHKTQLDNSAFQQWNATVERLDLIIVPSDWSCYDPVAPSQVT